MRRKKPKPATPKDAPEFPSVFHEDGHLDDEQAQFDQDNASAEITEAIIERLAHFERNKSAAADAEGTTSDDQKRFTLTIGFGYPEPEKLSGARKAWVDEFVGTQVDIETAEAYLDLVEAEADCLIRLGMIDVHLESPEADDKATLKKLEAKAEEAMAALRMQIKRHDQKA